MIWVCNSNKKKTHSFMVIAKLPINEYEPIEYMIKCILCGESGEQKIDL